MSLRSNNSTWEEAPFMTETGTPQSDLNQFLDLIEIRKLIMDRSHTRTAESHLIFDKDGSQLVGAFEQDLWFVVNPGGNTPR